MNEDRPVSAPEVISLIGLALLVTAVALLLWSDMRFLTTVVIGGIGWAMLLGGVSASERKTAPLTSADLSPTRPAVASPSVGDLDVTEPIKNQSGHASERAARSAANKAAHAATQRAQHHGYQPDL